MMRITSAVFPYQRIFTLSVFAVLLALVFTPDIAHARSVSGTVFDAPLNRLVSIFTGPIALSICGLGFLTSVGMLALGGELTDLVKKLLIAVICMTILLSVGPLMIDFFGVSGMVIDFTNSTIKVPSPLPSPTPLLVAVIVAVIVNVLINFSLNHVRFSPNANLSYLRPAAAFIRL